MEPDIFFCASARLNIIVVYDSQRRDIWWKASSFGRALGEFKGPSHYMQQKLVSRHHCRGKWNKPLIYERQRQGTLLHKGERGLRALPVSGSSMQTGKQRRRGRQGREGALTEQSSLCVSPPEGLGLQWRGGKQNRNSDWQCRSEGNGAHDTIKQQTVSRKDPASRDPQIRP